MTNLAVFDIDGTLTDTNAVDDACFLQAVGETLSVDPDRLDWSSAPHVTDSALLLWLAERHGRLPVAAHVVQAVTDRFVELLDAARARSAARFRPIAGAERLFGRLREAGWECALATGGWERSARLKLSAAGLDAAALPLASASDATTRVEIMELAVARARVDGRPFERIVSIGDGVWDVRAAAALQWPFVGIATGARALALRMHGATEVLPDFSDRAAVLAALTRAEPPTAALPRRPERAI
jgi:phosphoglycolate phosphatase-like HAD superfamily hydrolase